MKIIAIMLKDLVHELRSFFALFMMIAAPLLIAGLLYFAFGGLSKGGAPAVTATRVQVVDLDTGDPASGTILGPLLVHSFESESLGAMLTVSTAADEPAARKAVDSRQADAAVIIPRDFSATALGRSAGSASAITLYSDPALTFGPALLRAVVKSFVNGVVGTRIAVEVTSEQISARGGALDAAAAGSLAMAFARRANASREVLDVRQPSAGGEKSNAFAAIMKAVVVSMMVFFVFYTGASAAQSLVVEQEEGTLARLSVTPTPAAAILTGKSLAIGLTILVQVAVLLSVSALLFGIRWGDPLRMLLAFAGTLVAATGFGILLISFCKTSQQVGPVLGVGLTLTGMVGGLFTNFVPGMPSALHSASLAMPQGWASRLWTLALTGAGFRELALPALILAAMGVVFFVVGVLLHRRRFS